MKVKNIALLAAAIMIIATTGIGNAFAADGWFQYNPESQLQSGYSARFTYDPSQTSWGYHNDVLHWDTKFQHSDSQNQGITVNPRLNWDSSASTSGSNTPSISLAYGDYTWLEGHTQITGNSGARGIALDDAVTYHKTSSPYNNALVQSYNMKFNIY